MQRALMLSMGLLPLVTVGCSAPATTPVAVQLALGGFRVQALISRHTAADIDHVQLQVYRDGAPVSGAGVTVPGAQLTSPLTLRNLRMATAYEVRASAYGDAAATQLISDPAASRASFTTPARYTVNGIDTVSTAPLAVSLPLRLVDRPFAGQGSYTLEISNSFQGRNALSQVQVRLTRIESDGAESPLGTRTLALAEVDAGQVFPLRNLKLATTYKLYADGLGADGSVLSTESKSQVSFTTEALTDGQVEDTVPLQTLPLAR